MLCGSSADEPYIFITMAVGVIGALITIFSLACVITNTNLPQSIRVILLSFLVANVGGSLMLTHDTVTLLCHRHRYTSLTTISVTLSATHHLLIMLCTHIAQQSSNQRKARNYCALIVISWFISIALGTINVVTQKSQKKLIFSLVFLMLVLFVAPKWIPIVRTYKKKEKLRMQYQIQFLRDHPLRPRGLNIKCWKIQHVNFILISYLCCSAPWVLNEFREGLKLTEDILLLDFGVLVVYALNFFFPSALCVYLRVTVDRERKVKRGEMQQLL